MQGKDLTNEEEKFICENNIGGIVLFARNLDNPKQIHQLISRLQSLRKKQLDQAPLFIATDMEGGRVSSLSAPFTIWPSLNKVSALNSTSVAFRMAQCMGAELSAVGINVDFAPCVDVLTNPQNHLIGDRSAGTTADQVGKITSALVRGYIKSGIIPCAKHFPGHGNTIADSHEELPVDSISIQDLTNQLLPPFKKVFKSRLDMVMTAHIKFPAIDPDWPVTLSEKFLKNFLRNDIRYRNLVLADDLEMKALSKNYDRQKIPVLALKAGIDMLLYCHEPASCAPAFDAVMAAANTKELDMLALGKIHERILQIKKSKLTQPDPIPFTEAEQIIGHTDHMALAQAIVEGRILESPGGSDDSN